MATNKDEIEKLPAVIAFAISPTGSVVILAASIFISELVVMGLLYLLNIENYTLATLFDALMMVLLILPALHYLQLRPLSNQIKQRNKVEQALRNSEEMLTKVLMVMPVGVWLIDKNGDITMGNLASEELWKGAKYVGMEQYGEYKGWWHKTGQQVKADEWAAARAITKGEISLNEEIDIESFDGTRKVMLNSAVPILDNQNNIQGAIVINQDITRLKRAEKNLQRTNDLLERFFQNIHTLIAYLDRDFNFIRVNEAYASSAGHSPDYFNGKNHFSLYPHAENEAIFRHVVETGEPYVVLEKPFEYPDFPERGVTYWNWSLLPVKEPDSAVEGLVLSLVDVTEGKRSKLQLERRNLELRELSESEKRQRSTAEGLVQAITTINTSLDLDLVLCSILEQVRNLIPFQGANILLLEDHTLRVAGFLGYEAFPVSIPALEKSYALDDFPLIQQICETIQPLIINRVDDHPGWVIIPGLDWIRSYVAVPLVYEGAAIGVINLVSEKEGAFPPESTKQLRDFEPSATLAMQKARLYMELETSRKRLQALARKLVETQEIERTHIARELHDEAGQMLSFLMLNLTRLEHGAETPPHVKGMIQDMKGMTNQVLDELHRIAVNLRPTILDHLGLVSALENYTNSLSSDRLSVKFKAIGFDGGRLPGDIETALYRITHEAISNVLLHAHASNLGILLEKDNEKIVLFVEDDGIGMTSDLIINKDRLGIVGMRERAEMLGGSLTIESTQGSGTTIIVEVPYGS